MNTNIFYNAYSPVEESEVAEWILNQLTPEFPGITSEWTVIEMFRAFKKQVNLQNIEEIDANLVLNLFLSELGDYIQHKKLHLMPISFNQIMAARPIIFAQNLYAADALHAIIAQDSKVAAFITFDHDFKSDLGKIPILNPTLPEFKDIIISLKKTSQ